MTYPLDHPLRQQKQLMINTMRDAMAVRAYTATELSEMTGVSLDNIRKYLREMSFGNQRPYVSGWLKCPTGKWNALYMFGTKENAPRPEKLAATIERQLRRERRANGTADELAAKRKRHAENERRRWLNKKDQERELSEQEEARLRAAAFARIKPRMDPWAHLFHGGAAVLAGVAA